MFGLIASKSSALRHFHSYLPPLKKDKPVPKQMRNWSGSSALALEKLCEATSCIYSSYSVKVPNKSKDETPPLPLVLGGKIKVFFCL